MKPRPRPTPALALAASFFALAFLACSLRAQPLPRAEWGAPQVTVARTESGWTATGRHNSFTLDPRTLALTVHASGAAWPMVAAKAGGLLVRAAGQTYSLSLAGARRRQIEPYDTGARTGLKLTLSDWPQLPAGRNVTLYLTFGFEGDDEDLVFDIAADETHGAAIHRLDWPEAVAGDASDATILSNLRGVLLPRGYAQSYDPIRDADPAGTPDNKSEVQSNIIEDWSMSWWGFDRGPASMMVIVETPDDAAYQFRHPAGGPTDIGPRWRESLGALRYVRTARLCFLPSGGYVAMARRYRRYAKETGLFVSLKEKVLRSPTVGRLIGVPMVRARILTNIKPGSDDYNRLDDKSAAHRLVTFDQRAQQLRALKRQGADRLTVIATGWPHYGYDRQHPDAMPPSPEAGGWDGMRRLEAACAEMGYLFGLHDQYRDYYVDAPSFSRQFAIHEEDAGPAQAFPGSRFGDFKEGTIPFMDHWEGGKMTYLNPRFMLQHLVKNYSALFAHGIHPQGSYLDVFGYVPPDEDFNPEHPATRTDGRLARIACFNWCREHLGFVGTEAGCDWTVPWVDFTSPEKEHKGVPLPLFNLVYHDAVITPYDSDDLHGFLNAGLPQLGLRGSGAEGVSPGRWAQARRMAALQQRLAFVAMTDHVFLDANRRRERTTFADGTTVTVDWDRNSVQISPDL